MVFALFNSIGGANGSLRVGGHGWDMAGYGWDMVTDYGLVSMPAGYGVGMECGSVVWCMGMGGLVWVQVYRDPVYKCRVCFWVCMGVGEWVLGMGSREWVLLRLGYRSPGYGCRV